ncbi:hypothetical protein ACFCXC_00060 [Streptomyces microflavus]|uniref:Uncharacterized protein n=1 Tax=Streptomyces microflavus TaxID=1919 RepID=A0A6N9V9D2_STRMI|nr:MULTISPECIES: hypothetical protein [unclassified Streptomyces]NEB69316.1 hypothetical protein [Streptomyces microflavus]QTA34091.1 hypothetical protein JHY03_42870 [Streptomyces sp. CA-256286]WTF71219.1 hypothetical protein OH770_22570 [Streptomyces microflavus]
MAIIPTDLLDRIRALERQVRELMGSANTTPAQNSIVGGEVVIGERGRLRVRTAGDQDLVYLGRVAPDRDEETPQQGLVVRRDDGSLALTVWTGAPDPTAVQPVRVLDRRGNVIVADDTVRGGLARPYIPYSLPAPADPTRWESTNATTWTTLHRGPGLVQHPRLHCRIAAEGGAGGEVRLLVDGDQVGPVGGPGAGLVLTERMAAEYGATVTFEIQARVTTPGTTIRCRPLTLYGLES